MKKVGITGPPGSGKTTLWRAISGLEPTTDIATVSVPDARLDLLSDLHRSRNKVGAQIQLEDLHATARTAAAATARLRDMDAILFVAPMFGGLDADGAVRTARDDFLLADMGPVETRLNRARKDPAAKGEVPALETAAKVLEDGEFLSTRTWEPQELAVFSPLALLTLKPLIIVANVDEASMQQPLPQWGFASFAVSAALEAEVAQMKPDEAAEFLQAYGIGEPAVSKVIEGVYRSLDLITFFTASDKESRAWEVRRGATAPEAAGVIHSDLQRGFIRAEVVGYDDLVAAGSWDAAKAKGLTRVEGKDYVFKEADVTHFRFAV
ncbi:MAG: DUF933 domain-containing protein [Actinomycetota bacterium]